LRGAGTRYANSAPTVFILREETTMRNRLTVVVFLTVFATATVAASAQRAPNLASFLMSDRAAEIALARSASPKSIGDSAAILVLTKRGYVESAHGTNGFVCFVFRSFDKPVGDPGFWDPSNLGPACINPPAVRTVLPEILKRAEWVMSGLAPAEIAKQTKLAYASHTFPMPATGAMAYMLSPRQHLADTNPHWLPHLMFWFDKSMPSAAWGLADANNTILDGTGADPNSPLRLLLIPVRRWSDGTPAVPTGR
jgi:hypothetical protein